MKIKDPDQDIVHSDDKICVAIQNVTIVLMERQILTFKKMNFVLHKCWFDAYRISILINLSGHRFF